MKSIKKIYRVLYKVLPFKQQVFSYIKPMVKLKPWLYKKLHFVGVFKVEIDNLHSFYMQHYGSGFEMETDHFWMGSHANEPYSIKAWLYFTKKTDLILDIGANTGTYSLLSAALKTNTVIHAFEPNPTIFNLLKSNIILNNFSIHVHEVAVSNCKGDVFLYINDQANDYKASVIASKGSKSIEVKSINIDSLEFKSNYTLIKLDIEGNEPLALEGMRQLLSESEVVILMEVLTEKSADELNQILSTNTYDFFNVDEVHGYKQTKRIEKSTGNNILVIPKKITPIFLLEVNKR
jgi:FkbM family methyltransferase